MQKFITKDQVCQDLNQLLKDNRLDHKYAIDSHLQNIVVYDQTQRENSLEIYISNVTGKIGIMPIYIDYSGLPDPTENIVPFVIQDTYSVHLMQVLINYLKEKNNITF